MRVLVCVAFFCALAGAGDLVYLKNGRLLRGKVVSEGRAGVVVDLGTGKITLPRRLVRAIERGALKRELSHQVTQRDEWFLVLHRERLVGWRRLIHTVGPERVHAEERTVFFRPGGGDDVDIRRVEVVDRAGRPIEFLLSETYGKRTDMISGQTIRGRTFVRIRMRGKLQVKELELPDDWTLALPAWSNFLETARKDESRAITALDLKRLKSVKLVLRREADADANTRAVTLAGDFRPARALYVPGKGSLAVELNGEALVARRVSRERVELAREAHAAPQPLSVDQAIVYPFIRREAELTAVHVRAGLKITAPDAAWIPKHMDRGRGLVLTFEKISLFASLELFAYPLPSVEADADACLRNALTRLRLTARSLRTVGATEARSLSGLPARIVKLRGTHRGETLRGLVAIVRAKDRYILLAGAGPRARWTWAKRDLERFLDSLDVVP